MVNRLCQLETTMKIRPTKTDETKSWPFIRWIKSRNRWQVDARTATGGTRTFHATKGEAESTAAAARVRRTNEGSSAFDDRELAEFGWSVQQAIRFAVEHLRAQKNSVTLEQAIDALIDQKRAGGKTARYQRDIRNRLARLKKAMPGKKIAAITTADLDGFIAELALAPGTKNTFRRDIRTLWSFAEKRGWADAKTAKHTDRASADAAQPEIFTPAQAAALLGASTGDVLAFHAIGLFAGLRVSEIHRLDWSDVDLAGGYVHVSAKNSKTRSRRLVPILDGLRAWIQPVAKPSGPIIKDNFRKRQEAARVAAGITEWPDNGLRHSFVSYRLADTGNAALTALEAGHDQAILFRHYRELVTPKDAARYFNIRPAGESGRKVVAMVA